MKIYFLLKLKSIQFTSNENKLNHMFTFVVVLVYYALTFVSAISFNRTNFIKQHGEN